MSGMVTLSVLERGSKKLALRVITSVIAVFMTVTIIIYTDVSGEANLGRKLRVNEMGRYVEASNLDKSTMLLGTAEKPVLFFSLTCGTCIKAVDTLIKEDPEGSRWTPVQIKGEADEGNNFLKGRGYLGSSYTVNWDGIVPAMAVTKAGKTILTHSLEEMVKTVKNSTI